MVAGMLASGPARGIAPDLEQVGKLIRTHLPGGPAPDMGSGSVEAMIAPFGNRIQLRAPTATNAASAAGPGRLVRAWDDRVLYVRLPRLQGEGEALRQILTQTVSTQRVDGVILDLRFSSGWDFESVAPIASLAVDGRKPLLDLGKGLVESDGRPLPSRVPWVVLVNPQTSGSPEALAAVLRLTRSGLVLGRPTAGQASLYREFALDGGGSLAIATAPVKLSDGSVVPATGVVPDLLSSSTLEQQKQWMDSIRSAAPAASSPTNGAAVRSTRRRVNEAELVRAQREGRRLDSPPPAGDAGDAVLVADAGLRDADVLRAADLLRGIAVLSRAASRPSASP